jgi:hypothetical protein
MKSLCYILGAASHRRTHDALAGALSVFLWLRHDMEHDAELRPACGQPEPPYLHAWFIRSFYSTLLSKRVANKLDKIQNGRVCLLLKHEAFYQIKLLNRNTNFNSEPFHCPLHVLTHSRMPAALTVTRVRVCYTAVRLYSTRHFEISGPNVDSVVGAYGRRLTKNAY